jgi:hypothetical protein
LYCALPFSSIVISARWTSHNARWAAATITGAIAASAPFSA